MVVCKVRFETVVRVSCVVIEIVRSHIGIKVITINVKGLAKTNYSL